MAAGIRIAFRILFYSSLSHLWPGAISRRERGGRSAAPWSCTGHTARAAQAIVPHYVDRLRDECRNRDFAGLRLPDKGTHEPGLLYKIGAHRIRRVGDAEAEEPGV